MKADNGFMKAQLQGSESLKATIEALRAQLSSVTNAQEEAVKLREKLRASETALTEAAREYAALKEVNADIQRTCDRCLYTPPP